MPRIITIISDDVPDSTLFSGSALARTPRFTIDRRPDDATFGIVSKETPGRLALEVARPFMVFDAREVTRMYGVTPPAQWQPVVLTTCMVPREQQYDMWVDVVRDVAGMCGGLPVLAGQVIEQPDPWPWVRRPDGRWAPTEDFMDASVAAYRARTGGEQHER